MTDASRGEVPQPQVFRDLIPSKDLPAAQRGGTVDKALNRIQSVIGKYEKRESLDQEAKTQPTPAQVEERIKQAQAEVKTAGDELNRVSKIDDVAESGLNRFSPIRKLTGKRTAEEQTQQVVEAETELKKAAELEETAKQDLEPAYMYTRDYLLRESDPERRELLIEANRIARDRGPLIASAEMNKALRGQEQLQREILEYKQYGLTLDEGRKVPAEVFQALRQKERPFDSRYNKENIAAYVRMMGTFSEEALQYGEEHELEIRRDVMGRIMTAGMDITNLVERPVPVFNFVAERMGRRHAGEVNSSDIGYYAYGSYQLQDFFSRSRIPEGEARIPYIIAYTAGIMQNGCVQNVAHHMRDWLADTIPTTQRMEGWENKGWVVKDTPPSPRGLGSFITPESPRGQYGVERNGTKDPGLAAVMKQAGDIVRSVDNRMQEKRQWQSRDQFAVGEVIDPVLRLKNP